mgnify:CR=1 FL=1
MPTTAEYVEFIEGTREFIVFARLPLMQAHEEEGSITFAANLEYTKEVRQRLTFIIQNIEIFLDLCRHDQEAASLLAQQIREASEAIDKGKI